MKKSSCSMQVLPDQPLRELIFLHPHLKSMINALGVHGPFGDRTVRQVGKDQNMLEPVLIALLEVGICEDFEWKETLPAYGLLQLSELTKTLTDAIRSQLMDWVKLNQYLINKLELPDRRAVESAVYQVVDSLNTHTDELVNTVLPHINGIYELYYSPVYTSGKSNLLSYSIEFFPKKALAHASLVACENSIEKATELGETEFIFWQPMLDFHQIIRLMVALERVEERLLKPVVLRMEEEIITTFQKKKSKPMRLAFLSLPKTSSLSEMLSKREQEVLGLVAQGLMNKEIAERLHISLTTVISHRKNLADKLGIHSLAGLTVYAYTHGFLDDFILTNED